MEISCKKCIYAHQIHLEGEPRAIKYECVNPHSEFYRSQLNVTRNGCVKECIVWSGCACGVMKGNEENDGRPAYNQNSLSVAPSHSYLISYASHMLTGY